MALRSANGGAIYLGPLVEVSTQRWSGNWRVRDSDITQSDIACTLFMPVVQDNSWEWSAARDDVDYPEALGLAPGDIVAEIFFKLGAGTLADKLENTMVEEVSNVVDNANEVVRVTVRGKGGFLTPSTAIT